MSIAKALKFLPKMGMSCDTNPQATILLKGGFTNQKIKGELSFEIHLYLVKVHPIPVPMMKAHRSKKNQNKIKYLTST